MNCSVYSDGGVIVWVMVYFQKLILGWSHKWTTISITACMYAELLKHIKHYHCHYIVQLLQKEYGNDLKDYVMYMCTLTFNYLLVCLDSVHSEYLKILLEWISISAPHEQASASQHSLVKHQSQSNATLKQISYINDKSFS